MERLRGALLWLTGFAGVIVFMEPSPYEITSLLTIFVFVCTGLALRPALMPLIVLLLLYNTGFSLAVVQVTEQIEADHLGRGLVVPVGDRDLLRRDAVHQHAGAAVAADARHQRWRRCSSRLLAILSYFRALGPLSDLFLMYGRANATFNDPNVLGAFLVLPALLALQRVLNGRVGDALRASHPVRR